MTGRSCSINYHSFLFFSWVNWYQTKFKRATFTIFWWPTSKPNLWYVPLSLSLHWPPSWACFRLLLSQWLGSSHITPRSQLTQQLYTHIIITCITRERAQCQNSTLAVTLDITVIVIVNKWRLVGVSYLRPGTGFLMVAARPLFITQNKYYSLIFQK